MLRPDWKVGGLFYAWWEGDALPDLGVLSGFEAVRMDDVGLLAQMSGLAPAEVEARLGTGHRAYVARLDGQAVAYGWSATREADIGERGIAFAVPADNRYLWDFFTLEAWRGRGLYPRLLQAIVRAEQAEAGRFWIGHDVGNLASARGIVKAGFQPVGEIGTLADERLWLLPRGSLERARAAAEMLGLELLAPE